MAEDEGAIELVVSQWLQRWCVGEVTPMVFVQSQVRADLERSIRAYRDREVAEAHAEWLEVGDEVLELRVRLAEQAGENERLRVALAHIAAEPPWMVIGGRDGMTTPFGYILRLQRMAADALGTASSRTKEAPGAG